MAVVLVANAGITLSTSGAKIGDVIRVIQGQTEYKFFYDDEIAKSKANNVNLKNNNITEALDQLFSGTSITYVIKDKIIYLKKSPAPNAPNANAVTRKINGVILNEDGEPLAGAIVSIRGQKQSVVTDLEGRYTIETSEASPILVCSYIGYKPIGVRVRDHNTVNLDMTLDIHTLDEVVVTALEIRRDKKMLGYATQDIRANLLNPTGDPSVTGALDGKIAGLQINTANTGLGGSTKITIRGNSSLTDNNQPLWIVDGVPFTDNNSSDVSTYGWSSFIRMKVAPTSVLE